MSSRLSAPQKWHTGALYDAIWEFDLPPIVLTEGKRAGRVDTHGQPVLEVSETAQRLVLMAMAKHTNPTRDRGRYRCCPTVDRLATLTGVLARQVQLVLKTQKDLGYITEERQGMRAGRNRPARPSWWELHPDRWPRRTLDGREAGFATNGDLVMVAKPATDGHEAGHVTNGWSRSRPLENVDGREAGFTLTRNSGTRNTGAKPIDEPARAAARAELAEDASTPDSHAEMLVDPEPRQVALPLTGAVGLPAGAGVALPSNSPETLLEAGRQLWRAVRDPLLRGDVNVPPVLVARLRNTGTASFDAVTGVLVLEGALLPEDLEEPLI
ncbi:MAG: hypothetical protein JOZ81_20730, partial [Chloroflexi bacterium]|nr:hypothetical protein [Chloroflexota bacterium]